MFFWFSRLACKFIAGHSRSVSNVRKSKPKLKHNLTIDDLHIIMPKEKQTLTQKSKGPKYIPGTVSLQVLGSGARGAPSALYIFTDLGRYMFNCGEGTQRLAYEHKMKLSKLEQIFVTHSSWSHIGGLPGIALTIQDVGVKGLTLHGPPGVDELFAATEKFVKLKDLSIRMAKCDKGTHFEDTVFAISYVPVVSSEISRKTDFTKAPKSAVQTSPSNGAKNSPTLSTEPTNGDPVVGAVVSESETEDDVNYYEHEGFQKRRKQDPKNHKAKRRRLDSQSLQPKAVNIAMSYICKLKDRPGVLCLKRCVDRNVPPGPLLGLLKNGEDVTLPDGTVVYSRDVREPNVPGPTFLVVDCPTDDYVASLVDNPVFARHQAGADDDLQMARLVVHFTPPAVMSHPSYFAWMEKFSPSTQHLVLNESSRCMGSIAVHRAQYLLNSVARESGIFPSLRDDGIKIVSKETSPSNTDGSPSLQSPSPKSSEELEEDSLEAQTRQSTFYRRLEDVEGQSNLLILAREEGFVEDHLPSEGVTSNQSDHGAESPTKIDRPSFAAVGGQTLLKYHLRPFKGFDWKDTLRLHPDEYINEVTQTGRESFDEIRDQLRAYFARKRSAGPERRAHPRITFLGTGSCIPNKTRNTSGILVSTGDDSYMIVDCGEATYGQLVRLKGWHRTNVILQNLRAIYVSHMHADHHIGLIALLNARRRALESLPGSKQKLLLLAPAQIRSWLRLYHEEFEPILQEFDLISNDKLDMSGHTLGAELEARLLSRTNLLKVDTCLVAHCPYAYGVSLQHTDWKMTYSGDTMPCKALEDLGRNSTLLIHEATMEPELEDEAKYKFHSTTSQAIEAGRKMNARHVILTHFSQRYAKVPRLDGFGERGNVGIAFDNMEVGLDDLDDLPVMIPALKEVFADHHFELEEKSFRRQKKKKILDEMAN